MDWSPSLSKPVPGEGATETPEPSHSHYRAWPGELGPGDLEGKGLQGYRGSSCSLLPQHRRSSKPTKGSQSVSGQITSEWAMITNA